MIRIWKEPAVTVLAMSSLCEPKGADFAAWRSNDTGFNSALDLIPEIGGRVCYMSFGKGRPTNAEYITNILEKEHESVLEHASVSFGIQGISRTCSHELIRHRHLSFSQLSQRYVSGEAACSDYVLPIGWTIKQAESEGQFARAGYFAKYSEAKQAGESDRKAAEFARAGLPGCTETKLVVTGNLRAWRHFCKLRGSTFAEPEIRRLACVILNELKFVAPHVFADMEVRDGQVFQTPRAA